LVTETAFTTATRQEQRSLDCRQRSAAPAHIEDVIPASKDMQATENRGIGKGVSGAVSNADN
jgi:hypothetical protein